MFWYIFAGYVFGRLDQKYGYKVGYWMGSKTKQLFKKGQKE